MVTTNLPALYEPERFQLVLQVPERPRMNMRGFIIRAVTIAFVLVAYAAALT